MRDSGKRFFLLVAVLVAGALCIPQRACAQFDDKEAFSQSYNEPGDTTARRDTSDTMFTFREYFGGAFHKRDARIGVMFAGSTVFLGGMQAYNRDWWKVPVIWGGVGAGVGLGIYGFRHDNKAMGVAGVTGAALFWWGSLMDGVAFYKKGTYPQAGKATLYSLLLPGLGQAYNGEYWKIPIYWAGLAGSTHFLVTNNINYRRFKRIHNEIAEGGKSIPGITESYAKSRRNIFRRYRDYSILALTAFYLLQVIDANVFSYMQDFEMGDDLVSMKVSPAVIVPEENYAFTSPGGTLNRTGVGLRIGFTF